jgi:DNA-binding MurR/RpiR family transcriptional regulator
MTPPKRPIKKVSAPIRMETELMEQVKHAAQQTLLSQADIMRLCLAMGLDDLKRLDYKIASTLSKQARTKKP